MVLKTTLLFSLALVQLALASTVTIVSPKAKDVWHAGEVVEFKWTAAAPTEHKQHVKNNNDKKQNSKPGMLSIALATGPAQSLVIDRVIASNVNMTKGSYKWKIPKNINTTKKYVVEIGPNASDIAFAGYISIVKAPHHTNSTTTPTGKPTKSSPPTSTITSTPTKKHDPTSVCIVVPNKNGEGSTTKCHPAKSNVKKSHPKKKSDPKKKKTTQHKKKKSQPKKKTPTPVHYTPPPARVATPSV